jgi:CTP-dependent riboflavin kinase
MNRKTMIFKKMKHMIVHPYAGSHRDLKIKIQVEIEGETFNGVPHGLCFINFV